MTKEMQHEKFSLDEANIDNIAACTETFLTQEKYDGKESIRLRIAVEEMLLNWMNAGLKGETCVFGITQSSGKKVLTVSTYANHLQNENLEELLGSPYDLILSKMGIMWTSKYENGQLMAILELPKKKMSFVKQILIAIILGLIASVCLSIIPSTIEQSIMDMLINPLFETYTGFLNAVVGPMLFFFLLASICNAEDKSYLEKTIPKLLPNMLIVLGAIMLIIGCCTVLFYDFNGNFNGSFIEIMKPLSILIFDIIPDNLLAPFITGNLIQLVTISIVLGTTMLLLQKEVSVLRQGVNQASQVMQLLLKGVTTLMPCFMFLSIVTIYHQLDPIIIMKITKTIIFLVLIQVAVIFGVFLHLLFVYKSDGIFIFKKMSLSTLYAFITDNSIAAFPISMENLTSKMGVEKQFVSFALPFSLSLYKIGNVVHLIGLYIFAFTYSGASFSIGALIVGIFLCTILMVATPPVTGAFIASYTLILSQTGQSLDLIGIMVAIEMIVTRFTSCNNALFQQVAIFQTARKHKMIDETILRSR